MIVVAKFATYCTEFSEESSSASFDGKAGRGGNKKIMYRAMRVAEYLQSKYQKPQKRYQLTGKLKVVDSFNSEFSAFITVFGPDEDFFGAINLGDRLRLAML